MGRGINCDNLLPFTKLILVVSALVQFIFGAGSLFLAILVLAVANPILSTSPRSTCVSCEDYSVQ